MIRIDNKVLADCLRQAKGAARNGVVRTSDLRRATLTVLRKEGWLSDVVKGYCILSDLAAQMNQGTLWQDAYWNFLSVYLGDRFGGDYCLSPENSLDLLTGSNVVPQHAIIYSIKGGQGTTELPHGHSIFVSRMGEERFPKHIVEHSGVRSVELEEALCRVGTTFFKKSRETAMSAFSVANPSNLAKAFVERNAPDSAIDRIYSGLIAVGREKDALRFADTMRGAGLLCSPKQIEIGFDHGASPFIHTRSPHAARIGGMWSLFREDVERAAPSLPPVAVRDAADVLAIMDANYVHDAYHSLSIEGYRVSEELIAKIASGDWNPDGSEKDKEHVAALAARGYFEAFKKVKESVSKCIGGASPPDVVERDISTWYATMFSPSVTAGLLAPSDLVGYRERPVFIRGSRHVPPPKDALMDCMDALVDCLRAESSPWVRAVLGHFTFTYIHPYQDGNGRIGRFLMNTLLVSSGYPWTIIRSEPECRTLYLAALESASVGKNIVPFAEFVSSCCQPGRSS
ncbi:MAG: Fic family protein [Phycisphaerae bacterium]|jgi:hypothetical protein